MNIKKNKQKNTKVNCYQPRLLRNAIRHHHTLPVTQTDVLCHSGQLEQMDGKRHQLIGTGDNKMARFKLFRASCRLKTFE